MSIEVGKMFRELTHNAFGSRQQVLEGQAKDGSITKAGKAELGEFQAGHGPRAAALARLESKAKDAGKTLPSDQTAELAALRSGKSERRAALAAREQRVRDGKGPPLTNLENMEIFHHDHFGSRAAQLAVKHATTAGGLKGKDINEYEDLTNGKLDRATLEKFHDVWNAFGTNVRLSTRTMSPPHSPTPVVEPDRSRSWLQSRW
jgi:hypothetical protein